METHENNKRGGMYSLIINREVRIAREEFGAARNSPLFATIQLMGVYQPENNR